MTFDIASGLFLLALILPLTIAYLYRVARKGRPRFDRIDQAGGSKLLAKSLMEMGYWGIEPVARALVSLRVSPNTLTWLSLLVGAASGVSVAVGRFGSAAFFLFAAALLDVTDGMVARLTNKTSHQGYVLDSQIDRYVEFFFLGGLVVYYRHVPEMIILTLLALLGSYMVSYSTLMARFKGVTIRPGSVIMRRAERIVYMLFGSALSAVTVRYFEGGSGHPVLGYPMVVALTMIGVFGNISAFALLFRMLAALREQDRKEHAERALASANARTEKPKDSSNAAKMRPKQVIT